MMTPDEVESELYTFVRDSMHCVSLRVARNDALDADTDFDELLPRLIVEKIMDHFFVHLADIRGLSKERSTYEKEVGEYEGWVKSRAKFVAFLAQKYDVPAEKLEAVRSELDEFTYRSLRR